MLSAWPEARVNIDPKRDSAVAPLIALLRRMDVLDRVCIGSFSDRRIAAFRSAFGKAVCTSMGPREAARFWLAKRRVPVGAFGADCAQLPLEQYGAKLVDPAAVAAANRIGLQVHVWTIDDEAEMERLVEMGVHGIMTDRPALLRDVLKRRGRWS